MITMITPSTQSNFVFVTRVTRRVPLVEQELLTLPEFIQIFR